MSPAPIESPLVAMRLSRVVLRDGSDQQWIYLSEVDGERGFPIIIGSGEASEIHRVVTDVRTERPLTHQLAASAIAALGSRIVGVDIVDLRNNTFFARLLLENKDGGPPYPVDARPSDALALGLRAGAPIRVSETVLEQVRTDQSPDPLPEPGSGPEPDEGPPGGSKIEPPGEQPGGEEPGGEQSPETPPEGGAGGDEPPAQGGAGDEPDPGPTLG